MKFIRDIISEKRAQAQGRTTAATAVPRAPEIDEVAKAAPLPQDVLVAPRAPAVAKPAFQLPLSALVEDEDDEKDELLNLLNPMEEDETDRTETAIGADNFEFASDDWDEVEHLADENDFADDSDPTDDASVADDDDGEDLVAADAELIDDTEDDSEQEAEAPIDLLAYEDTDDLADDDAILAALNLDDDPLTDDGDFADADEVEDDDLSAGEVAEDEPAEVQEIEPETEPETETEPSSRDELFSAIADAGLPEGEDDDAPMATGLWTGAMPPRSAAAPQMSAPQQPQMRPAPASAPQPSVPPRAETAPVQRPQVDTEDASIDVPAPAIGRGSRRAGRVKTRLLGFNSGQGRAPDPFASASASARLPDATEDDVAASGPDMFPVGWLVVVAGPGVGAAFSLHDGVAQIGRGAGQGVRLDLGDNSISRENHAAIAYDSEQRKFYLGHGGKANLVRLNNRPVLSTEELSSGDLIRIGETTLRFVALCGGDFDWSAVQEGTPKHASFA